MKHYKYIILSLLACTFCSCEDELKEEAALNVAVNSTENVSIVGDTVFVKKGTPMTFTMDGTPDFITFFSGEKGKQYIYKDRDQVDPADIVSSKLSFAVWYQYGNATTAADLLRMYISDTFPGMAKNNFKADSALVEQFKWNDLVDPATLPTAPSNAAKAVQVEVDLTPYLGKRVAIAARYQGHDNSAAQPRVNFVGMKIVNQMKDGTSSELYAMNFGFTPVNMMCHHNLSDQKNMTTNREYGTVTNNMSGIWNLTGAKSGDFFIHSSNGGTDLKYSWLVSDLILANACSPDAGASIKDLTGRLDTYTYTYNDLGVYKATFLATNSNYKAESRVVRELNIKVVE